MERIVVTGGLGTVGEWVVDHFRSGGYHVVCLDLERPDRTPEGVECLAVDLTEQGQTWEAIRAADPNAVVHLAAHNWTGLVPGTTTFMDNVAATYHVLSAAGTVGAPVANVSSLSALGYFDRRPPASLPVPVSHPLHPDDEYAASKIVGETIAEFVASESGVGVGSVRPAWVNVPDDYQLFGIEDRSDPAAGVDALWSYVDVRDLAALLEAVLTADLEGHEPVYATAADTFLTIPTEEALAATFEDVAEAGGISGHETPLSLAAGRETFDWAPEYSWRDVVDSSVDPPGLFE